MKKNYFSIMLTSLLFLFAANVYAMPNGIDVYGGSNCVYQFRDTTSGLGFTPTTYYWDFGDGNSASTKHASHAYSTNGNYNVYFIVSDGSQSDTSYAYLQVNCRENRPLKASFSFSVGDTNQTVRFNESCDGRPVSYHWDFGDGGFSNDRNPVHVYSRTAEQTYTVILRISDSVSTDSFLDQVLIPAYEPCKVFNAYFHSNRDTNCKRMLFTNASHYTATSYYWSFGDGSSSTAKDPSHLYAATGTYTVKLIANSFSCTDSIVQQVLVSCRTCFSVTANVVLDVDTADPSKAILYNYSSGNIYSHFWDFGDGNSSTAAAPLHNYSVPPGNITITYIVGDTGTCYDTAYINFSIDSLGHIKRGNVSFTLQVIDKTNTSSIDQLSLATAGLNIYPVPAHGELNLNNVSDEALEVRCYNQQGQLLEVFNLEANANLKADVSHLPAGLYLLNDSNGRHYRLLIQ